MKIVKKLSFIFRFFLGELNEDIIREFEVGVVFFFGYILNSREIGIWGLGRVFSFCVVKFIDVLCSFYIC